MRDEPFKLCKADKHLIELARTAVHYYNRGDPVKDVMDETEMIDALRLLVAIKDSGYAV